jgi:transposase
VAIRALHMLALGRMAWHAPTRAYAARRVAEGLSKREILRCLKRYIAREVYHLVLAPTSPPFECEARNPASPSSLKAA